MSQNTFQYLCNELQATIERQDTRLRKAVPTDKRVVITLWFLATGADFRTIARLFGVSKSTVSLVVKDVSSAILLLLPRYIRFPTVAALKEIITGFKRDYGFPQCVGAIDGTHIPIVSPTECPADWLLHVVFCTTCARFMGMVLIKSGWKALVHQKAHTCPPVQPLPNRRQVLCK